MVGYLSDPVGRSESSFLLNGQALRGISLREIHPEHLDYCVVQENKQKTSNARELYDCKERRRSSLPLSN